MNTVNHNLPTAVTAALSKWGGEPMECHVPEPDFPFGSHYLILGDMEFDPFVVAWCGENEFDIITLGNAYIKLDSEMLRFIADWADGIDLNYEDWQETAEGRVWLEESA